MMLMIMIRMTNMYLYNIQNKWAKVDMTCMCLWRSNKIYLEPFFENVLAFYIGTSRPEFFIYSSIWAAICLCICVGGSWWKKKNSTIFNVQYIMNAMCRLYNFVVRSLVRSFVRSSCCQLSSIIPHQLDFILAAAAAFDVVIVFNHQKL